MAPTSERKARRAFEITAYEEKQKLTGLSWLWANGDFIMLVYMPVVHVLALLGLGKALALGCSGWTIAFALVLQFLSELGITAGVHRLWSHRSYQAGLPLRVFLMLLQSLANQGSIHRWATNHRVHHLKCETEADPHNAERGFFFSHVGWLLVKEDPRVLHAAEDLDLTDLEAMPEVRFQRALDPIFNLLVCFAFPTWMAWHFWGESVWAAFLVPGCLRYVVCLNLTWLVNSAAHAWGFRPYDHQDHHGAWPAENRLVALGSIGEGWHNWHHAYPHDYAASELGMGEQFNPTKLFIDACAWVGLVSGRKRASRQWSARKERLSKETKKQKKRLAAAPSSAPKAAEVAVPSSSVEGSAAEEVVVAEGTPSSAAAALRKRVATMAAEGAEGLQYYYESLTGIPMFKVRHIQTPTLDSRATRAKFRTLTGCSTRAAKKAAD